MPRVPPSFRELTPEILAALQSSVETGSCALPDFPVGEWAEKILRYCEIHHATLGRRAREKWGAAAPIHVGAIACFFLSFYAANNDLRFLNAALKLADFRWLRPPSSFPEKLTRALSAL